MLEKLRVTFSFRSWDKKMKKTNQHDSDLKFILAVFTLVLFNVFSPIVAVAAIVCMTARIAAG